MTTRITPEQAKTLLDNADPGPWELISYSEHAESAPDNVDVGPGLLATYDGGYGEDPEWLNAAGNLPLVAAAPELARIVIDQADEIEKLQTVAAQFERFLERFYTDFAKALGREDLLGAAEDGSEDDGETIYQLARDTLHEAREAWEANQ